jgi:hypothetical protein
VKRTQIPAPAEWRSVTVQGEEEGGREWRSLDEVRRRGKDMGKKEAGGSRMRRKGEEGGRRRVRSWGRSWRRRWGRRRLGEAG